MSTLPSTFARSVIVIRLRAAGCVFAAEMSLPAISKHLKVLERVGLVSRGRNAQYPSEMTHTGDNGQPPLAPAAWVAA